jgi:iron-sulfur cluster repair protein YtfE (RIC family)
MVSRDRATALSVQLALTHQALRDRVRALRRQLRAGAPLSPSTSAVLEYCAGFCSALERHHSGEDEGLFPVLRREFPELAPTIDKLAEDHWLIAGILRRVRELVTAAAGGADPAAVAGELDGLAAIMDSHFAFEERGISESIDGLGASVDEGQWLFGRT